MQKFTLKYQLRVVFDDDSVWIASKEDISETDPTKSSFYDLLQIKKAIRNASLVGVRDTITVDLLTGMFELNDHKFQIDQNNLPPMQRELIFFRQHQYDLNVKFKDAKEVSREPGEHRVKYFIGWKINIKGKNYQQIVGID